ALLCFCLFCILFREAVSEFPPWYFAHWHVSWPESGWESLGCMVSASTGNESRRFLKDRWAEAAAQAAENPKKAGTVLAVKARTRKKAIPTPRTDLKRKQRA